METIRKIIRAVRLVLGWTMALSGAVGCAACLTFFVLTVMEKLEITTTLEYIMAASLLMAGMLLFQIILNVGMCLYVLPVMGLTLPFISYGGSSIVSLYAMLGLVSGVHARPEAPSHALYIQPHR